MIRLLSGLVLAVAALAAILFLPTPGLLAIATAVAALAAFEYERIVGGRPYVALVAAYVCLIVGARSFDGGALGAMILLVGAGVAIAVLRGQEVQSAAAEMFALVYIGVPLGLLVLVHALGGREAVVLLLFTVVVSDSAQYYTGRMFGRRALAPAISPKKTIEGAVGGVVIGTLFFMVAGRFVLPFARPGLLAVTGVLIVVLGIAGDLFESRLKRTAGVKDSSALIPGHGGVLDRIDALLFAVPPFYIFLNEVM